MMFSVSHGVAKFLFLVSACVAFVGIWAWIPVLTTMAIVSAAVLGPQLIYGWFKKRAAIREYLRQFQPPADAYCDTCGRLIKDPTLWPYYCRAKCADPRVRLDDDDSALLMLWMMAAAAVKSVAYLEGPGSREWAHAAACLIDLSSGRLSPEQADYLLRSATEDDLPDPETIMLLPSEIRVLLLRLAVDVALVDGKVTTEEISHLRHLWGRLGGHPEALETLLRNIADGGRRAAAAEERAFGAACDLLGVSRGAHAGEIRDAYKKLVKQHHPDLASPGQRKAATAKTAEINAAYDLLMGAAAA